MGSVFCFSGLDNRKQPSRGTIGMAHDIFISYANSDEIVAQQACRTIEGKGVRCWIAPRNILPGMSYAEALIDAINHSSVLLLVFSARSNRSQHVRREVERAVSKGIRILPFKIDGTIPDRDMEYYLSSSHWLDCSSQMHSDWQQTLSQSVVDLLARQESQRDEARLPEKPFSSGPPATPPSDAAPPVPSSAPSDRGGWLPRSTPQSVLWLNIISEEGHDFYFSLTDSHRGVIVPHDRVQLPQETYNNLRGVLADLTNPGRAAAPADFAKLGLLLFRVVLPPSVQDALSRHGGPLSFATEELQLPWELLHDGRKFLCLSQPVARQPQTYQVADMLFGNDASDRAEPGGRVLIIADPAGDLPSAAAEAEDLRGLFHRESLPCDTLIGPRECSYLNIMNRLSEGGYDVIHYCGHACTLPERQCSAIVLANRQLLMAEEICRVMRGNPVAFLNACHTSIITDAPAAPRGVGRSLSSAQNVRSLAQAFVHGNRVGRGRAVIGSMWWLHDDVARGLARSFYEQLLRGQTLGESLRLARCHVEQTARDPALWSCYVLFGDPLLGWQCTDAAAAPSQSPPSLQEKPPDRGVDGMLSGLTEGPPWGDDTRVVLLAAVASMSMMNWSFLSTIHLLLGFTYLDGGLLNAALRKHDLNPDVTRRALRQVLAKSSHSNASPGMTVGDNLKRALADAKRIARDEGDGEVRERHLLRAMLELPGASAANVLQILKVDVGALLARLREVEPPPPKPTVAPRPQPVAQPASGPWNPDGSICPHRFSEGALAALEAAAEAAQATGWREIRGPHVFLGLLKSPAGVLWQSLQEIGVSPAALGEVVVAGCRQTGSVARSPRLHRGFLSGNARNVIQQAERLAGNTRLVGERELAAVILQDPNQFATQVLKARQVDVEALLAKMALGDQPEPQKGTSVMASPPTKAGTADSDRTSPAASVAAAPPPAVAAPGRAAPAADPLSSLVEQFESQLARADWAAAAQTAGELVKVAPQRALGHLLKSRISRQQAALETDADIARELRHQALRVLEHGLHQCSAPTEQQSLRQAIVDLYYELAEAAR